MLLLRFWLEVRWLLPSPVGDSTYFLTAAVNYCGSGVLATTAFPIDPSGQARMIWHGFVAPMLFGTANLGCGAAGYYLLAWLIEFATLAVIATLARRRHLSLLSGTGIAVFALAAQSLIAFRPEALAMLWIALAEFAITLDAPLCLGACLGALFCTQPTIAGLYALVLVVLRPELLRRSLPIVLGGGGVVILLLAWYPFPVQDLLQGVLLQARTIVHRTDGPFWDYYAFVPFLPFWSVVLLVGGLILARRKPLLLLVVPVLWYFGPRLPATYYNLVPIAFLFLVIASDWSTPRVADWLGSLACAIGLVGLVVLSARDGLTVARYGDTFRTTAGEVEAILRSGAVIGEGPGFLSLTNPSLHFTEPRVLRPSSPASARRVDLYSVNGRPSSPCPLQSVPAVGLSVGDRRLFNSNSGWMVYICDSANR